MSRYQTIEVDGAKYVYVTEESIRHTVRSWQWLMRASVIWSCRKLTDIQKPNGSLSQRNTSKIAKFQIACCLLTQKMLQTAKILGFLCQTNNETVPSTLTLFVRVN